MVTGNIPTIATNSTHEQEMSEMIAPFFAIASYTLLVVIPAFGSFSHLIFPGSNSLQTMSLLTTLVSPVLGLGFFIFGIALVKSKSKKVRPSPTGALITVTPQINNN